MSTGYSGTGPAWFKIGITLTSFLLILGFLTFERHLIELEMDSSNVYSVTSTWWGIKSKRTEIRWLRPEGYEYSAWCARGQHGWYPYLVEDDGFHE